MSASRCLVQRLAATTTTPQVQPSPHLEVGLVVVALNARRLLQVRQVNLACARPECVEREHMSYTGGARGCSLVQASAVQRSHVLACGAATGSVYVSSSVCARCHAGARGMRTEPCPPSALKSSSMNIHLARMLVVHTTTTPCTSQPPRICNIVPSLTVRVVVQQREHPLGRAHLLQRQRRLDLGPTASRAMEGRIPRCMAAQQRIQPAMHAPCSPELRRAPALRPANACARCGPAPNQSAAPAAAPLCRGACRSVGSPGCS